jgi:hypothetical protein
MPRARVAASAAPGLTTLFIVAAKWRGMTELQMVAPVSGQILTTQVETPGT